MNLPPSWFFRTTEPRVAKHIGPGAATLWVQSRFWWVVAWILWVPVGLSTALWAQTPGSPHLLWLITATSCTAALALTAKSLVLARSADRAASAFLSEFRGYRMSVACPITTWEYQWVRAITRADSEHEAHLRLAQACGVTVAVEQLVQKKRSGQAALKVALSLTGFLIGFAVGVLLAFAIGQTASLGVLFAFIVAVLAASVSPLLFRSRFEKSLQAYRAEIAVELAAPAPLPAQTL
jgi:uncharacterized membrane protein YbhN (UPF0104 family)